MNDRTARRLMSRTCLKTTQKPSESANRPPLPKSPSKLRKSKRPSSNRKTIKVERVIKMKKGKKAGIIRRVGEVVNVVKAEEKAEEKAAAKDVEMAITRLTIVTVTVIGIETIETTETTETVMEADGTTIINEVEAAVAGVVVHRERQLSTIAMTMAAIIAVGGVEIVVAVAVVIAQTAVNVVAVEEVVVVGTEMTTSAKNSIKTMHTPPRTHLKKLIMIMNQSVKKVEPKAMTISNNNSISNEEGVAAGTAADVEVEEVVDREIVEEDHEEAVVEEAVKVADEVEAIEILIISVT